MSRIQGLEIFVLHRLSTHKDMDNVVSANNLSLYFYTVHMYMLSSLRMYNFNNKTISDFPKLLLIWQPTVTLLISNLQIHTSKNFKYYNDTRCQPPTVTVHSALQPAYLI